MMTIGNFIGEVFPKATPRDLDFFPWPEMNPEFGTETIEAPIDGWMMAAEPEATPKPPRNCSTTSAPPTRRRPTWR